MRQHAETTQPHTFYAARRTRRLHEEPSMLHYEPADTQARERQYHAEMREKQLLGYVILD